MTIEQKRQHCSGCHDDVYNHGCGGSKECWMLSSMKLIKRREIHVDEIPPFEGKLKRIPDCYHRPRFVYKP